MRSLRAVPLMTLALVGCSLGGNDEPKPVKGAPREVARVVGELDAATREGDSRRICSDLFTVSARRRAGGKDCASLLHSTARELRNPSSELITIRVTAREASASVHTRATGPAPLVDQLVFRRERGGYRIEALG